MLRFTVVICVLVLADPGVFFIGALTELRLRPAEHRARGGQLDLVPRSGSSAGIFLALPFAIWFFLAIEELPLAAEESHDPSATSRGARSTAC